jgi:hypothetical protein
MERVSDFIRKLYPGRPFMVVMWSPPGHGKTIVEMVTNCDLDKVAGVLRETAGQMKETSDLDKLPQVRGNA